MVELAFEDFIWKTSIHFEYESTKISKKVPFLGVAKSTWSGTMAFSHLTKFPLEHMGTFLLYPDILNSFVQDAQFPYKNTQRHNKNKILNKHGKKTCLEFF